MSEDRGSERFVTVATFPQLMSAELAKDFLENEGIPAQILHRNAGSLYGDAIGGIPVQVPESLGQRATEILEEADATDDGPEDEPASDA